MLKKKYICFLVIVFLLFPVFMSSASAGEYVTKNGFLVALSKPLLIRGLDMYRAGDNAALNRLLMQNQSIFIIKGGVRVYVEDWSWSGYVRIRPKGHTLSLWTLRECIE